MMKNLFYYHTVTLTPIFLIMTLYTLGSINTLIFMSLFFVYAFLFRPLIDFKRLVALKLVNEKDWKKFIGLGLIRFKYYNQLIFGKTDS